MKTPAARRVVFGVGLLIGSAVVVAEIRIDEPSSADETESPVARLSPLSAVTTELTVADLMTSASLSTTAELKLTPATSSVTLQPATRDAATTIDALDAVPAADADKSGTDPTKFPRTLGLRNEYQRLTNDKSFNLTTFTYIEPFADGRMNLRLKAPLAYTDAAGPNGDKDEFGLSDISMRYNWLAHVDASKGILLGADLAADSATEDVLGRGSWTIGPSLTYGMFLSPSMIFAPAYQHNISSAGDDSRNEVNESVIDLYMVFTAADKKSWLVVDPTLVVEWENDQNTPVTLDGEYGRNVGTLLGWALNAHILPGIGIGQDRPTGTSWSGSRWSGSEYAGASPRGDRRRQPRTVRGEPTLRIDCVHRCWVRSLCSAR